MNFYTTPPHSPKFLRKKRNFGVHIIIILVLGCSRTRVKTGAWGGECFANVQLFSEIYAKNLEKSLVISNFGCLCLSKKE